MFTSYDVREIPLDFFEVNGADDEKNRAGGKGDADENPVDGRGAEEHRARVLYDAHHGIERENPRIFSRNTCRIDDGSHEKKELNEKWKDESHIAIFYVHRGEKKPAPDRCHERDDEKDRKHEYAYKRRRITIVDHHAAKDNGGDGEINKLCRDR